MVVVPEEIETYAASRSTPPHPTLRALADHTRANTSAPGMMTGPLEGGFLQMLVHALRPALVVEIGTFTGYGAISMALALPPGGRLVTCDVDPATNEIARRHAEDAGVADRIDFRLGPALDTLATIDGPIDFAFIDADKTNYRNYYEAVLPKLADSGLIAVDNVLWSGRGGGGGARPPAPDDDTAALREFNDHLARDERVVAVMTTVRDGVTLVRRRT